MRFDSMPFTRSTTARPRPFLQELAEAMHDAGDEIEPAGLRDSGERSERLSTDPAAAKLGGYGLDAQWCDDFHHALHTLLTGESLGILPGFWLRMAAREVVPRRIRVHRASISPLACVVTGAQLTAVRAAQFVVFSKNHDQIGNRMLGDRLQPAARAREVEAGGWRCPALAFHSAALHGRGVW